jgi:hypothetical protein
MKSEYSAKLLERKICGDKINTQDQEGLMLG